MKQHYNYILITTLVLLFGITCSGQHDHDHDHDHDHATTEAHDHNHDEPTTSDIWLAVLITCFAGFAAFVGAFSMFCVKPHHLQTIPIALAFSAGVIIYLLFMNLIPECIELLTHIQTEENAALARFYALLCVIGGLGITWCTEIIFHKFGIDTHAHFNEGMKDVNNHQDKHVSSELVSLQSNTDRAALDETEANALSPDSDDNDNDTRNVNGKTGNLSSPYGSVDTKNDDERGKEVKCEKPSNLSHLSKAVAMALVLHHLPEGIATFISLYYDLEFGILIAIALAVHDIPAGVCIAVPTYCDTGSKTKPFIYCIIAGLIYPLGALIGWAIIAGAGSEEFIEGFIGVLFGVTAGIMLHISFVELLPTAIITATKYSNMNKDRKIFTMSIIALFIGFLVIEISNILLEATGGHSH